MFCVSRDSRARVRFVYGTDSYIFFFVNAFFTPSKDQTFSVPRFAFSDPSMRAIVEFYKQKEKSKKKERKKKREKKKKKER